MIGLIQDFLFSRDMLHSGRIAPQTAVVQLKCCKQTVATRSQRIQELILSAYRSTLQTLSARKLIPNSRFVKVNEQNELQFSYDGAARKFDSSLCAMKTHHLHLIYFSLFWTTLDVPSIMIRGMQNRKKGWFYWQIIRVFHRSGYPIFDERFSLQTRLLGGSFKGRRNAATKGALNAASSHFTSANGLMKSDSG